MPVPEPVVPLEPWQTAWPAGVAAVGMVVAAVRARAHLWPARAELPWLAGLVGLALAVRLVWMPAWSLHYFDGHEAEYWDIFRGVRPVGRGGTVLYPSMQWLWWGLGRVLPHHPRVPVAVMAAVGALGCAVATSAVRVWTDRKGALAAGLVLALHPVLAAWSSSAYNVILPWTLSAVVVWCAAHLGRTRHPSAAVAWLGAFAWALVAATRLEAAWIGLPALLLALGCTPPGQPWGRAIRRRAGWAVPGGVGLAVGVAAVLPLVYPGEVPGAGERGVSFLINRAFWAPYQPLDSLWGALAVGAVVLLGLARRPGLTATFAAAAVAVHLGLATFDDFGDRHTLGSLLGLAAVVGVGCAGSGRAAWAGRGLAAGLVGLLLVGGADLRERFYGSEEAFAARLDADPRWSSLPRWTAEAARTDCGWISEDPRVAPQPQRSHFNLIDPREAEALRAPHACLRWCADVQDWRWSSRGVRDRALRTAHLYRLQPVAVVEDAGSGYACLVLDLGRRRCCPAPEPGAGSDPVADPDVEPRPPARDLSHEEDDAFGLRQHSPVP